MVDYMLRFRYIINKMKHNKPNQIDISDEERRKLVKRIDEVINKRVYEYVQGYSDINTDNELIIDLVLLKSITPKE